MAAAKGDPRGGSEKQTASISRSKIGWIAVVVLFFIATGLAGYLIGNSSGEDLSGAREAGAQQGHDRGVAIGTQRGYAVGLRTGRRAGLRRSYGRAYKAAYAAAFEEAGLSVPGASEIKVEGQP